ncbi:MAG: metallophosphoesterase family protein [Bradymonadia bacterium]
MKIAHISDLHWLDLSGASPFEFLNKRLTGGFNLLAGRARKHTKDAVRNALETIAAQHCDHLIVTGDLTNLALSGEFLGVKKLLNAYFDDERMTIVPGNHDFYTRESAHARRFETLIYGKAGARIGDLDIQNEGTSWPFVRLVGDVAVIGLNSAQPRPWFVAAGRLGTAQIEALTRAFAHPEIQSRFKIVALHHHLFQVVRTPGECWRHLDDRKAFLDVCAQGKCDLIVHGHNHDFTQKRYGDVVISEAGSCSVSRFERDPRAGKFNIYEIVDHKLMAVQTWRYASGAYALWKTTSPGAFECVGPDVHTENSGG